MVLNYILRARLATREESSIQRILSFFLYDAIHTENFSWGKFIAFHIWQRQGTYGFTYATSNSHRFFAIFSQSVMNNHKIWTHGHFWPPTDRQFRFSLWVPQKLKIIIFFCVDYCIHSSKYVPNQRLKIDHEANLQLPTRSTVQINQVGPIRKGFTASNSPPCIVIWNRVLPIHP